MADSRKRVGAIDRALQILDILTERGSAMSSYELARTTGAPASTIYKIVDELIEREMLTRPSENTIWLGPRLMRYGLTYRANVNVYSAAAKEMKRLCAEAGETVQICARDGGMMTVIDMARGDGHFNVASDIGTRVPLNWTASGRLLLGHLEEAERVQIFAETARPSETGQAEIDPHVLSEQSRLEFENRLAVQMSASEYSVACIASPICDVTGACLATISIVLPQSKAESSLASLTNAVQRAAANVEKALGGTIVA
ncbi:IclR family transcriptional regulator [Falsihalocynthiibacter sp. SS001]|uniref:IclR family transcriptional regulator n=1 Tax=Falsihalocynthiibacter sp. SS001 TaxID=3349698 RepID=UPI0036D3A5D7